MRASFTLLAEQRITVLGVHLIALLPLHFAETHGTEHNFFQVRSLFPSEMFEPGNLHLIWLKHWYIITKTKLLQHISWYLLMEYLRRGSKFLKVILGFWLKYFRLVSGPCLTFRLKMVCKLQFTCWIVLVCLVWIWFCPCYDILGKHTE